MSWSSFYGVIGMTKRCNSIIRKIAIYMELNGENTFKVSRIEKPQSLEIDERPLDEIEDVTELKGIGKGVGKSLMNIVKQVNQVI